MNVVRQKDAAPLALARALEDLITERDGRADGMRELCHQLSRIADNLEKLAEQNGHQLKPAYTVAETAQMLGKSGATIRRWIREGRLESTKSSEAQQGQHLIPRHAIERYLHGRPRPGMHPSQKPSL